MSIENIYDFVKGLGSEIGVNLANTARSLTGQPVDKDRVVTWSHTFNHVRQLAPSLPDLSISLPDFSSLTSGIRDHMTQMAARIYKTIQNVMPSPGHRKHSNVVDPYLANGKTITRQFHVLGDTFATETVSRDETVAAAIDFHVKQERYLQANRHRIEGADALIDYHQKAAENAKNKLEGDSDVKNKDWIDSNYFRRMLSSNPRMTFKEIAQLFVSAPVNMRYHSVALEDSGRSAGFYRLGVVTDPTNGWTNLKELKEMAAGDEEGQQKKIDRISGILEKAGSKKSNPRIKQSADFACEQLFDLEKTIERRRQILQDQMLQLVVGQVEKNAASICGLENGGQFNMVHLSLLNPRLKNLDPSGWMHDEENQILDMYEIFKEFRGKELIFDGKGPFIDDQGRIHLPQGGPGWPKQVTLNPVFLNTSVQRHTKNDGIQAQINREGFSELRRVLSESESVENREALQLLDAVEQQMEAGKSNYSIAELIGVSIMSAKMALSSGCMSAKDRTGLVAALIVHDILSKGVDEQYADRPMGFRKKVKTMFAHKILDESGPAARVILDNTGESILKCCTPRFPKISLAKRVHYAFKQILMNF